MPRLLRGRRALAPLVVLSLALPACAGKVSNFDLGMDEVLAGDDAAAEPLFVAALNDPGDEARARAELDELQMRRARDMIESDPQGAIAMYQDLLSRDPNNHRARMGLGRVLELERQFDQAITVLSENPECKTCGHQLGETYEQRGRQRMANADYAGATEDYEKALAIEESPDVLVDISEMYTVGHHGTAVGAAQALQRALPHITHQNTTLQELWAVERRDLALLAASQHEFEAVDLAVSLADPRVALDGVAREHASLDLRLDVARMYQEHEEYQRGLDMGLVVFNEAKEQLPEDQLPAFKEGLMGLYSRLAHHHMQIGESRKAAVVLTEGLRIEPDHHLLRYQAVLAMSAVDQDIAEKMMQNIPEDREHWHRVHALVRASRAQKAFAEGQLEAAQQELVAAGKEYPDLLEVRLVRAEILAGTRAAGLARGDYKTLRSSGLIKYPEGKVMRYAEALAEIQWCRARYEEEAAQLNPYRMPGFGARLATLEADITAFYPFEVRRLPKMEPRVQVTNQSGGPLTLEIEGPGVAQSVSLDPGKKETLVFTDGGVVEMTMDGGDRTLAILAEQRTFIDLPIGPAPEKK